MADLNNLLDDLNNDEGMDDHADANDEEHHHDNDDELYGEAGAVERATERPGVPAALAAVTAARRRRPVDDENDIDAGEQYYQTSSTSIGSRTAGHGSDDFNADGIADDVVDDDDESRNYNPDYEQLKALWTSELACPELLPHDAETIVQNINDLAEKEELVDVLHQRSRMHATAAAGGGPSSRGEQQGVSGELASLVAQITKMDLDRTRFMLVDLMRTRMAKIENHALHNRTLVDRMTEEERSYLRQYGELLEKHYRRTVLNHLPKEAWKKLDEPEMIDSPDLEQFVFCRVVETVQIDVRGELSALNEDLSNEEDEFGDNIQEHVAGSYLIVMYKLIRDLVLDGKVELLM